MTERLRYTNIDLVALNPTSGGGILSSDIGTLTNSLLSNTTSGELITNTLIGINTSIGNVFASNCTIASGTCGNVTSDALTVSSNVTVMNSTFGNILVSSGTSIQNCTISSLVIPGSNSNNILSTNSLNLTTSNLIIQNPGNTIEDSTISSISCTNASTNTLIATTASTGTVILISNSFNTASGTTGELISNNTSIGSSVISNATTGYTQTLIPNVVIATLGNISSTLSTFTNLNVLSGFTSNSALITNINILSSSTVSNIFPPETTISNTIIQNATISNLYSNPGGASVGVMFISGQVSTPYTSSITVLNTNNDFSSMMQFRTLFTNNSLVIGASSGNIWVGSSSGNVNVGAVGNGSTIGSTLVVQCSSGGSNALLTGGGILTIINSTNSTNSSNGGSFTTYGGAAVTRNLIIGASLTKGSGTFDIPHPVSDKGDGGFRLRHSFVESPNRGDNLYRFTIIIPANTLEYDITLPEYFNYLNGNVQIFVRPIGHFGIGYGCNNENENKKDIITIHCNQPGKYNILVIGTRKDPIAKSGWDCRGLEYNDSILTF